MEDLQDRSLTCADCGQTFVFTAQEQSFYQEKGFKEPRRCKNCRANRKTGRSEGGGGGGPRGPRPGGGGPSRREGGGGGDRREREMHPAVCSECGASTMVPFLPQEGRPVLCRDCYRAQRG